MPACFEISDVGAAVRPRSANRRVAASRMAFRLSSLLGRATRLLLLLSEHSIIPWKYGDGKVTARPEPALRPVARERAYCVLADDNLLLSLDFQRFHQSKRQTCLGGKLHVAIPGESCSASSGASADQAANQSALPSPGQSTNQGATACPATNQRASSFALTFFRKLRRGGAYLISLAIYLNSAECESEFRCALEAAGGFGAC